MSGRQHQGATAVTVTEPGGGVPPLPWEQWEESQTASSLQHPFPPASPLANQEFGSAICGEKALGRPPPGAGVRDKTLSHRKVLGRLHGRRRPVPLSSLLLS